MSRADDIVQAVLESGGSAPDADTWRRLCRAEPAQARAAVLLLRVEGMLRADVRPPAQADRLIARLDAQVARRVRSTVMQRIRSRRWAADGGGLRLRRHRRWLPIALAAGLLLGAAWLLIRAGPSPDLPDIAAVTGLPDLLPTAGAVRVDGAAATTRRTLRLGEHLDLGPGGAAVLTWTDGTRVAVHETTVLSLAPGAGKRVALAHGRLTASVARQPTGEPMRFATPHGEAEVVGTRLRLAVGAGCTSLAVDEGLVRLRGAVDGSDHLVAAGQAAAIGAAPPPVADPPRRQSVQAAAQPALDLAALVRAQASPVLAAPYLAVGEAADPVAGTLVRIFDRQGMLAVQTLVWPPEVRGGVLVAALAGPDGPAVVACAAEDARVPVLRLLAPDGTLRREVAPAGIAPPFAITAGHFVPGLAGDQLAVLSRRRGDTLAVLDREGVELLRIPVARRDHGSSVQLETQRRPQADRILLVRPDGTTAYDLIDGWLDAVAPGLAATARERALASLSTAAGARLRGPGDRPEVGGSAGLWQLGASGEASRALLERLAAGHREAPGAILGIIPGAAGEPDAATFAAFLLRRYGDLAAVNRHFGTAFARPADIAPPAGRGRGAWDRRDPQNPWFIAWQHCCEAAVAERLTGQAAQAIAAGFPPDLVLMPALARGSDGLARRQGGAASLYAAGIGLALALDEADITAADGLLAGALSSGFAEPPVFRLADGLSARARARLAASGARVIAGPPAGAGAIAAPLRHDGGRTLVQLLRAGGPPRLASLAADGAWDGGVLLTPFRTRVAVEALALRTEQAGQLRSPPITGLGPGDQIELSLCANGPGALRILAERSDVVGVELADADRTIALAPGAMTCRYALRIQVQSGPIRLLIRPEGMGVTVEAVQATVQRAMAAQPDVDRMLGTPFRGQVAWDVFVAPDR